MTGQSRKVEIEGRTVTIRPMCRADMEMEQDFVRGLSAQSRHYRFLGAVGSLSTEEAQRLCDVDGHLAMAFVATIEENGRTRQVGVSRYAPGTDSETREIAITVADDWQHHGLGTRLAEALIQHAREHGVSKLYSVDLADNTRMRMLAHDLGMSAARDPADAHQVIYSLSLASLPPATERSAGPAQP